MTGVSLSPKVAHSPFNHCWSHSTHNYRQNTQGGHLIATAQVITLSAGDNVPDNIHVVRPKGRISTEPQSIVNLEWQLDNSGIEIVTTTDKQGQKIITCKSINWGKRVTKKGNLLGIHMVIV